jgi:hypothetical protein
MGTGIGIGEMGNGRAIRPRSMMLEGNISDLYNRLSPASDGPHGTGRMGASPESSSMFFYASDARSSVSSQGPFQQSNPERKTPSLVDANGIDDTALRPDPPPHRAATLPLQEEPKSKFFHANDVPISKNTIPKTTKATNASPSTPSPRLATFSTHPKPYLQQRPPSPLKEEQRISRSSSLKKVSPRNYTPLVPNGAVHQIKLTPLTGQRASQDGLGRRSSLSTPVSRRVSHAKAGSISSLDSNSFRRRSLRLADVPTSLTAPATKPTELEIAPKDGTTNGATAIEDHIGSVAIPQSPSKVPQTQNKLQQMNELAANARRERKVLDLEISNSSLLAINRTLEREMRKQNNELRRYRRLSRSGRLSLAPSLRSISVGGLSMLSETDTASDFSELPEEEELDDPYSDDESLFDAGTMTPNMYAEHDARLRAKDEKRLQLDLSKHRELLVDSQKMNQSLKRCLGWTEDLIREGQKALDYHVRVSDIGVGGRVLTPDEVEPDTLHRRGLLSPAIDEPENPMDEGLLLEAHLEDERGEVEELVAAPITGVVSKA